MIVGGLQGGDIMLAHCAGVVQIRASPRKPLTAEPHHQEIRHEPGVAAVAIREGMNLHQPVMEAHRDLVEPSRDSSTRATSYNQDSKEKGSLTVRSLVFAVLFNAALSASS
jgi:hypothetical protein